MWTLEGNDKNPGKVHYLPCGQTLMVSRKQGHILLTGDVSISRQHACFVVTHLENKLNDPEHWPTVKLKDLGAKYGTFVNDGIETNEKIGSERTLLDEDRIRFGRLTNMWRLKYHPLVVSTSALASGCKGELQRTFLKLGGHIVPDWSSSCDFLVMNDITLTVKVVCALAAAKPIVTPEFFSSWVDAVENGTSLPDASQYLPALKEAGIAQSEADFSPKVERKHVLDGIQFLFASSRQFKRMETAVNLAGGNAVLLCDENYELVTTKNYLLVQTTIDKIQNPARERLFLSAKDILKKNGLRAIPDSDIGLAVLYIRNDTHCNSSFKVSSILRPNSSSSAEVEVLQIYATETQTQQDNSISLTSSTRRIPPTSESSASLSSCSNKKNELMPPPANTPGPSNCDPENKENRKERKRLRTCTAETSNKRSKSVTPAELEPTQPLEITLDDDEGDDLGESQVLESKFQPKCHSTQILENDHVSCTGTINNSTNVAEPEPTAPRSIPFEPYTLPSLKTEILDEDIISTQPCEDIGEERPRDGIKEEPQSFNERKRQNVEEESRSWLECKKKKTEDENGNNLHQKRKRKDDDTLPANSRRKFVSDDDEDFFAMPAPSDRSRPRADVKRLKAEDADEYFSMTTTSRADRMRNQIKMEKVSQRVSGANETKISSTSVHEKSNSYTASVEKCPVKNDTWISSGRPNGEIADSSMKLEPADADPSESHLKRRSFAVIEFKAVMRKETLEPLSEAQNESYGGLKNFKRFKKNRPKMTSLPKIVTLSTHVGIGRAGSRSDMMDSISMTIYPEEALPDDSDDNINALFDVPVISRGARKRR
ncbi:hypothetical protein SK128_004115 [Halocaridina rubra]|uniref:Nibrin n=1 Tax=Halocaridina rubra TaxID=373956 RepID=A0AAN9A1Q3_HALRR